MKNNCRKILVAGDIMLDSYHFGKVDRISPEAPVPVFLETGNEKQVPGGAANVAVNIAAIGVDVSLCSVVGTDPNGSLLVDLLGKQNVITDNIICDKERMTTTKLRYIGPNNQQIMRADTENVCELNDGLTDRVFERIGKDIDNYCLILLSDYNKGFLSEKITRRIIELGNKNNIPVLIDVKEKNLEKYMGAYLLKPNRRELSVLTGMKTDTKDAAAEAAKWLCIKADARYVLTTLGADGMILVDKNGLIEEVKSTTHEVYDVTGAGDTSIAYLAAELVKGTDIIEAMKIANYAAGIQVSKVGTSIVYPEEVIASMNEEKESACSKILSHYQNSTLELKRKSGKRIVFTNGCFDILHIGHVEYLKMARQLGDILVIGLNTDASVRRLKGPDRPVNPLKDRAAMLEAFSFVDYIIPFDEDTPEELIKTVSPDVLVKGGDYKPEEIVGADHVIANGGVVKVLPFVEGHSTTTIIKKIKEG